MPAATLVLNRNSGAALRIEPALRALTRPGECDWVVVESGGSIVRAVETGRLDGPGRLIVAGGDGTVSKLLHTARGRWPDREWALIPAGTGNDFARSLGVPLDDPSQALQLALHAPAVAVDHIELTDPANRPLAAINALTGGFGATVARGLHPEDKRFWGPFAYWMSAVSNLGELQPYSLEMELDEQTIHMPCYGLCIANGRFIGGGYPIAPQGFINDGMLDVTIIPVLSTIELLSAGVNFMLGWEDPASRLISHRAARIVLRSRPQMPLSVDGDSIQPLDEVIRVVRRGWRVVAGPHAPAIGPVPVGEPGGVESRDGEAPSS